MRQPYLPTPAEAALLTVLLIKRYVEEGVGSGYV